MSNLRICHSIYKAKHVKENSKVRIYKDQWKSWYAGKDISKNENWEQELRNLQKVGNHENIVRYFTTCKFDDNSIVTIMELCDCNLKEYLNDSNIFPMAHLVTKSGRIKARTYFNNVSSVIDLLYDIALGLNYLHDKDILHCNIEPSNVFLIHISPSKILTKLGGFSHCTQLKKKKKQFKHSKSSYGSTSLRYMAPECPDSDYISCTKSSDVYALGILMYFTITEGKEFPEIHEDKSGKNHKIFFTMLRSSENFPYSSEERITMISMIKHMIDYDQKERLTVEKVLCHPTFYTPHEKVKFLLRINEGIKNKGYRNNPFAKEIQTILNCFDSSLTDDRAVPQLLEFKLIPEEIFKNHEYLLEKYLDEQTKNCKYKNTQTTIWKCLDNSDNVSALLSGLRDKVVHACDKPPRVPKLFEKNFKLSEDTYDAKKFLEVFLSQCPQLLIHLYKSFRNFEKFNIAKDFYTAALKLQLKTK